MFFEFHSNKSSSDSFEFSPVIVGASAMIAFGWVASIAVTGSFSPLSAIRVAEKLLHKHQDEGNSEILVAEIFDPTSDDVEA